MIYDCFPFFNELDVLDIRLHVLNDVVDKFVLVEACFTHTGNPKGFVFEENKNRFSEFADKIIHIKLTEKPDPPLHGTSDERKWFLENYQRNAIAQGLSGAKPTDIILVSDCDEIPDPKFVAKLPTLGGITRFQPKTYNYFVNLRNHTAPYCGWGTVALSFADFSDEKTYRVFPFQSFVSKVNNPGPTATKARFLDPSRRIKAGWHFTYLGDAQTIKTKLLSTADGNDGGGGDLSLEEIFFRISNNKMLDDRMDKLFPEPLDEKFPQYLLKHATRFSHLILPTSYDEYKSTRMKRMCALIHGFRTRYMQDYLVPFIGPLRRKLKRLFL